MPKNKNSLLLLESWRHRAIKLGKSKEEIEKALQDAIIGNYKKLLEVLKNNQNVLSKRKKIYKSKCAR